MENIINSFYTTTNSFGAIDLLDHKAITKVQAVILVTIIVVASIGAIAYFFWTDENQLEDTIKIGVVADLDLGYGKETLQSVKLAAEQINAEGGLLGRSIEVIGEDKIYEEISNFFYFI